MDMLFFCCANTQLTMVNKYLLPHDNNEAFKFYANIFFGCQTNTPLTTNYFLLKCLFFMQYEDVRFVNILRSVAQFREVVVFVNDFRPSWVHIQKDINFIFGVWRKYLYVGQVYLPSLFNFEVNRHLFFLVMLMIIANL